MSEDQRQRDVVALQNVRRMWEKTMPGSTAELDALDRALAHLDRIALKPEPQITSNPFLPRGLLLATPKPEVRAYRVPGQDETEETIEVRWEPQRIASITGLDGGEGKTS